MSVSCTVLIVEKTSVVSTRKNLVERDSSPHVLKVIQDSIQSSTGLRSPLFGFHKQEFFGFQNPDYRTWVETGQRV